MEEPIKTTEKDESKSFSILRQFLRFAISSIVYHRIAAGDGGQRERYRTCSGTGGNDNESSDLFRNERVQTEIEKEIAKVPSPANNTTIPSPSLSPAFVDKDYCGIKGLKFMDAVAHDGTVVDSNVYAISQWIEKGVLPSLHQLHSFKFCILTTRSTKTTSTSTARNPHNGSKDVLETFHFQFIRVPAINTDSKSTRTGTGTGSSRNSVMEQLKSALEDIRQSAETYGSTGKAMKINDCGEHSSTRMCTGINNTCAAVSSMNIVLEFQTENDGNDENDDHDLTPAPVQPELFARSTTKNPMQLFQQHEENDQDNAIIEIDDDEHDHESEIGDSHGHAHGFSQCLGQNSQSQDSLNQCLDGVGRREIARVMLPNFHFVISRECMVHVVDDFEGGKEELSRLFPNHHRQYEAVIHQNQTQIAKDRSPPIAKRKIGTESARKKRQRSTPPLTPMRIHNNQDRGSSSQKKSSLSSIKRNLDLSAQKDQHHTPMYEGCTKRTLGADGRYQSTSPVRSPLFITPKGAKGKHSPRSGSLSEAPTYVVPLSSGRKSGGVTPLSTSDSVPRPNKFHF